MAKVKAPLFSLDAAGSLDKSITYRNKPRNKTVSKYAKPGDVNPFESSPRQKDQRSIIGLITACWQCKTDLDKSAWDTLAKEARFKGTGYHYFLHLAKSDLKTYLGLASYWTMNYNIGNKIPDLSGNGYHGTLMPVYPCDCPQPIDSYNKKNGKALYFNGSTHYLRNTSFPIIKATGDYTIECYVRPLIIGSWKFLLGLTSSPYDKALYFSHTTHVPFYYTILSDASYYAVYGSPYGLSINKWLYFVLTYTYSSKTYKVYQNGKLVKTQVASLYEKNDSNLLSAGGLPPYYGPSYIDNVRTYTIPLLLNKIQRHYSLLI